jgi:cell division protein DivIC
MFIKAIVVSLASFRYLKVSRLNTFIMAGKNSGIRQMLKKKIAIPSFLKNKYAIAVLAFLFWMLFFDRNSVINQYGLLSSLKELKHQQAYYTQELKADSVALNILMSSEKELEKFAREKYLMKRDNEDIFLIIRE